MRKYKLIISVLIIALLPISAFAGIPGVDAITVSTSTGGQQVYSLSLQALVLMTVVSLLPALLMTMTSFTRIIIVLAILRQATGLSQTPTNQILMGIALFMSLFIMAPVMKDVNANALQPYISEKISAKEAILKAEHPFREFMLKQTRKNDVDVFMNLSGQQGYKSKNDVPFTVLMPAFLTSELKTAFQIGFILFLPFLIIDIVVASVLMSMGMMMLSPLVISLPFKIMLFVLVDGWTLIMSMLASSFGM